LTVTGMGNQEYKGSGRGVHHLSNNRRRRDAGKKGKKSGSGRRTVERTPSKIRPDKTAVGGAKGGHPKGGELSFIG